jgi:hypothetical protein
VSYESGLKCVIVKSILTAVFSQPLHESAGKKITTDANLGELEGDGPGISDDPCTDLD